MQDRSWNRDDDYVTLVKWWKQWEFGVVPKECLPPDGIIVEDNGTPICAGGLYIGEGTQFAFMEWIVTDKNADARRTHTALKMCIDSIMDLAKSKGIKLVYTATKEQALQFSNCNSIILPNLPAFQSKLFQVFFHLFFQLVQTI